MPTDHILQCVDLVLADNNDPEIPEVTRDNCQNSSDIGFNLLYTTPNLTATGVVGGATSLRMPSLLGALVFALVVGMII